MPCNGISIGRLSQASTEVLHGQGRTVVMHGPRGHLLPEGRAMLGELHRLCLADEPEGVSTLIGSGIDLQYAVSIMVEDEGIERLGRSTRAAEGRACCAGGIWRGIRHRMLIWPIKIDSKCVL